MGDCPSHDFAELLLLRFILWKESLVKDNYQERAGLPSVLGNPWYNSCKFPVYKFNFQASSSFMSSLATQPKYLESSKGCRDIKLGREQWTLTLLPDLIVSRIGDTTDRRIPNINPVSRHFPICPEAWHLSLGCLFCLIFVSKEEYQNWHVLISLFARGGNPMCFLKWRH